MEMSFVVTILAATVFSMGRGSECTGGVAVVEPDRVTSARGRDILGTFLLAGTVCCVSGGVIGWSVGWLALLGLNPISAWRLPRP